MKFLALETSSERGSLAVINGSAIIERWIETPRAQTSRLLPLTKELLSEASLNLSDLDGIAFGRGPGSFTGLRVATAIAQGIGLSAALPILPISSLTALAQQAYHEHGLSRVLVCVDAHMGEVYWAAFEIQDGLAVPSLPESLTAPQVVSWKGLGPWGAAGNGCQVYSKTLASLLSGADQVLPGLRPRARDLFSQAKADLVAGRAQAAEQAKPAYLRDESAWKGS